MPPPYGVLVVTGMHTHQENYAVAFAADKRCRMIAVTDEANIDRRRRDLNERLAKLLNIPYIADLDQALARKDVDIVSICAPPERRGRIAVACARAGKHLYLDKSLVPRIGEADDLVAAVQKAGVKSHMFSFLAQKWPREAKELIQGKKLGKLLSIHCDSFFAKGKTGTAKLGMRRREEYPPQRHQLIESKREVDNVAVYPIVLIRFLTGLKFKTLLSVTGNYFFQEHQKNNVEDFGLISALLDDGMPVTIAAGRYGWTTHPAHGVNRVVLVGSERTIVVDANRPRLEVYTDDEPWTPPQPHPQDPMFFWTSTQEEMHTRPKTTWTPVNPAMSDASYFVDRIEANRDSEINAAEAALSTEVLLAAYQSAATREVVNLPLARG